MKFIVTQADRHKSFEEYGLKTMAYTGDKIISDIDEIEKSENIMFRFSTINIDNFYDLLSFQKKCKCGLIIDTVDDYFFGLKDISKYEIKIYNYYIE